MSNSFMSGFGKDMKLFMETEGREIEEVNIPVEFFTEHEVIETAVRNLILRYNRDETRMDGKRLENSKLSGIKIRKDSKNENYLEFEFEEEGTDKIYRVAVTYNIADTRALKIKEDNFLREIDEILDKKFAQTDKKITEDFEKGEISRDEWIKQKNDMICGIPSSALEYMKQKVKQMKKYYQYITEMPEYKGIFLDDAMTTYIAHDSVGPKRKRMPSDREPMERANGIMSFEDREAFFRGFTKKKAIRVSGKGEDEDELYRAYIIEAPKDNGEFIVMEPVDGEKTTFITFEKSETIKRMQGELKNEGEENVYEHIISKVLSKTRSEKGDDDKIVSKYHVSEGTYKRNLEYMITGNDDLQVTYVVKNERNLLVR